jgi:hypothetical protein
MVLAGGWRGGTEARAGTPDAKSCPDARAHPQAVEVEVRLVGVRPQMCDRTPRPRDCVLVMRKVVFSATVCPCGMAAFVAVWRAHVRPAHLRISAAPWIFAARGGGRCVCTRGVSMRAQVPRWVRNTRHGVAAVAHHVGGLARDGRDRRCAAGVVRRHSHSAAAGHLRRTARWGSQLGGGECCKQGGCRWRSARAPPPPSPMLPRQQVKRWRKDMSRARSWLLTLPISIALTVAGAVPAAIIFGHYTLG